MNNNVFQGRRLPDAPHADIPVEFDDLCDGDYWKWTDFVPANEHWERPEGQPKDECWVVYYGGVCGLPSHEVEEHEDGTITIEPRPGNSNSILITSHHGGTWHGYIRRGRWEPC